MRGLWLSLLLGAVLISGLALACAPAKVSTAAADFYKNNTVELISSMREGGGVDYATRLFASYWTEVTGGKMVVKNETGGGGIVQANLIYTAKPDGLTLGSSMVVECLVVPQVYASPGVQWDASKFSYILDYRYDSTFALSISTKKPYATIADLQKVKGLKTGSAAATGHSIIGPAIVAEVFGLDGMKVVLGYKGTSEVGLANGTGELDFWVMKRGTLQSAIDQGFIKTPLLVVSTKRNDLFPGVPAIPELVKLTPQQENLIKAEQATLAAYGVVFFAPPGIPKDRLEFLRNTFTKIAEKEDVTQKAQKTAFQELYSDKAKRIVTGKALEDSIKEETARWQEYKPIFGPLIDKYKQ